MKRLSMLLAAGLFVAPVAFTQGFFDLVKTGTPGQVRQAIANGVSIQGRDAEGLTPLMWAAFKNPNPEIITTLLENGAKVEDRDAHGTTAVMWAAIPVRCPAPTTASSFCPSAL